MSTTYRGTYLIQAFRKPSKRSGPFKGVNPFAFGGGGSGLSREAEQELSELWEPEYMGAAEYEFGAFRDALNRVLAYRKEDLLVATCMEVKGCEATYQNDWYSRGSSIKPTTVYVIANKNHLGDIAETLHSLLTGAKIKDHHGHESAVTLKRGIQLWEALYHPKRYWDADDERRGFAGGLELDNGWFVFTDEEMFRNVCAAFSVPFPEQEFASAVRYVPPKALFSTTRTERGIKEYLLKNGSGNYHEIAVSVYNLTYKVGDVVAPEHFPLCEQIENRLRYLVRKKVLTKDRKTKRYTLVPVEAKA